MVNFFGIRMSDDLVCAQVQLYVFIPTPQKMMVVLEADCTLTIVLKATNKVFMMVGLVSTKSPPLNEELIYSEECIALYMGENEPLQHIY